VQRHAGRGRLKLLCAAGLLSLLLTAFGSSARAAVHRANPPLTIGVSLSFSGDFSQVNGDVEAAFPLNIHSHPGSRRVSGEVNGGRYALRITTVNGDIKVDTGKAAKE